MTVKNKGLRRRWFGRHWLRQFLCWVGLTVWVILWMQTGVLAETPAPEQLTGVKPEALDVLQLVCVSIGLFAGSLLTVESRRWRTFFVGLLGIIAVASAIAAIGINYPIGFYHLIGYTESTRHYTDVRFPAVQFLLGPAITGLALGIVLIGSWWWGNRQGYTHALYVTLLRPDKEDREFDWLFQNWRFQNRDTEKDTSNHQPSFWQAIYFRAAAARYRRLKRRPEINGLYHLIVDDVLKDAEEKREIQLRKDKIQKLTSLLSEVESQYSFTLPIPPPSTATTTVNPEEQ